MNSNEITIRPADGGYIVTERQFGGRERIFPSLEALFKYLLQRYEGRSEVFKGNSYGKVEIVREG